MFTADTVAGRATTTLLFPTCGLSKPRLARALIVGDKIQLEIEFRCKRTAL